MTHCSCGARLPEDARFCHRCGKPLYEIEPVAEIAVPTVVAAPPHSPELGPISFHNPIAVRIALLLASVATMFVLFLGLMAVIWLGGAGFAAVLMYRRRTGQALTVPNGARLGWITGILTFTITTVIGTIMLAANWANISSEFQNQMGVMASKDPNYAQALRLFENPYSLATACIAGLTMLFVLFALSSVAGAALGAKLTGQTAKH